MDSDRQLAGLALPEDARMKLVALPAASAGFLGEHPDESRDAVAIANPRRKRDFLLGRAAARQALSDLCAETTAPIRKGSSGEPVWPRGFVGSITHCEPWTVAAVAPRRQVFAIGIDLENTRRMCAEDVRGIVCRPPELEWIAGGDAVERLTILFAAKEAIFKAVHPSCHRFFEFLDVELVADSFERKLAGTLLIDLSERHARGHRFDVRYSIHGEYVFAAVLEEASDAGHH